MEVLFCPFRIFSSAAEVFFPLPIMIFSLSSSVFGIRSGSESLAAVGTAIAIVMTGAGCVATITLNWWTGVGIRHNSSRSEMNRKKRDIQISIHIEIPPTHKQRVEYIVYIVEDSSSLFLRCACAIEKLHNRTSTSTTIHFGKTTTFIRV